MRGCQPGAICYNGLVFIVAEGAGKEITVLGTDRDAKPIILKGHSLPAFSVVFTPNSKQLISASDSGLLLLPRSSAGALGPSGTMPAGPIRVWEIDSARTSQVFSANACISQIEFAPDGEYQVWLCEDTAIRLVSAATGEVIQTWNVDSSVSHVSFLDDGRLVMLQGRTLVDVRSERPMGEVPKDKFNRVAHFAIRPDGSQLVACTGKIRLVDLPQATTVLASEAGPVHCVAYSRDGNWLAAGIGGDNFGLSALPGSPGKAFIWDTRKAEERWRQDDHTAAVTSVAFGPALPASGRIILATGSADGTVKIWELPEYEGSSPSSHQRELGKPIHALQGHVFSVTGLVFSPDGWRLASATELTVKVWDLRTGLCLLELTTPADGVTFESVKFSPRGDQLAARCSDGTICVWDSLPQR